MRSDGTADDGAVRSAGSIGAYCRSSLTVQRERWITRDREWTRHVQRTVQHLPSQRFLIGASRCGDGALWYATCLLLPFVAGRAGWLCLKHLLIAGAINLALYAAIKRTTARKRPFIQCPDIRACTRTLDEFSFPSGHTLHAVAFSVILTFHFAWLAAVFWVFAAIVAFTRVALGLHYPTDVAAGAAIGAVVASGVLLLA